jgi:ATP-dependent phosphofructokinase / diphosphate-dependent phosphofructokinase
LRIAVLTGGGDCPGLNAAIRAVAQRGWTMDDEVCGIHYGWSGLTGEGEMHTLTPIEVRDILHESGTMLGTSRTNPGRSKDSLDEVIRNLRRHDIDALVAIGGDDTLSVAAKLHEAGVKVAGIPKTIDNDVPGTDFCIGFDTATGVIADALDRLLSTAKSHARIMVMEVMGRDTGWLAVVGGLAGGADFIAIPEVPVHIDYIIEHAAQHIATHRFSVMAIAEGTQVEGLEVPKAEVDASDQFGHVRRRRDRAAHGHRHARYSAGPSPARRHAVGPRPLHQHADGLGGSGFPAPRHPGLHDFLEGPGDRLGAAVGDCGQDVVRAAGALRAGPSLLPHYGGAGKPGNVIAAAGDRQSSGRHGARSLLSVRQRPIRGRVSHSSSVFTSRTTCLRQKSQAIVSPSNAAMTCAIDTSSRSNVNWATR